jgi:hypothetical protein
MLQTAILDCELFDLFPFLQNGFPPSIVYISQREIVQALVQTFVVVVFDED